MHRYGAYYGLSFVLDSLEVNRQLLVLEAAALFGFYVGRCANTPSCPGDYILDAWIPGLPPEVHCTCWRLRTMAAASSRVPPFSCVAIKVRDLRVLGGCVSIEVRYPSLHGIHAPPGTTLLYPHRIVWNDLSLFVCTYTATVARSPASSFVASLVRALTFSSPLLPNALIATTMSTRAISPISFQDHAR